MHQRTFTNGVKCDTIGKRARQWRHEKNKWGHYPASHPTKKVTRGRMRASKTLRLDHRKFTLKQLIAQVSKVE